MGHWLSPYSGSGAVIKKGYLPAICRGCGRIKVLLPKATAAPDKHPVVSRQSELQTVAQGRKRTKNARR